MCIIIYKPQNQNLPSKSILDNCLENNKDGAGYMFNTFQDVIIRKGFFKNQDLLDNLENDLDKFCLDYKDVSIVIHYRIATAGLVKSENCHPFPISNNVGKLQSTHLKSDYGIAHNGIINIKDDNFKNLSDTQIFIKDVLSKIDLKNKAVNRLLKISLSGSKMIIFNKYGLYRYYGDFIKSGKIFYSNNSYKKEKNIYNYYSESDHWRYRSYSDYFTYQDTKDDKKDADKKTDFNNGKKITSLFNYCEKCSNFLKSYNEIERMLCDDCYYEIENEEINEIEKNIIEKNKFLLP